MNSLWAAVITGFFAVSGALGGVLITQRQATRLAELDRQEGRRSELRSALVDLSIAGARYLDLYETIAPAYAQMSVKDFLEFAGTDSGQEFRRLRDDLSRSITQVRFLSADPGLQGAVAELLGLLDGTTETVNGKLLNRDEPIVERVVFARDYLRRTRAALHQVETAAVPLVQTSIEVGQSK